MKRDPALSRPLDTGVDEAEVLRQLQVADEQNRRVLRERFPELAKAREAGRKAEE